MLIFLRDRLLVAPRVKTHVACTEHLGACRQRHALRAVVGVRRLGGRAARNAALQIRHRFGVDGVLRVRSHRQRGGVVRRLDHRTLPHRDIVYRRHGVVNVGGDASHKPRAAGARAPVDGVALLRAQRHAARGRKLGEISDRNPSRAILRVVKDDA